MGLWTADGGLLFNSSLGMLLQLEKSIRTGHSVGIASGNPGENRPEIEPFDVITVIQLSAMWSRVSDGSRGN